MGQRQRDDEQPHEHSGNVTSSTSSVSGSGSIGNNATAGLTISGELRGRNVISEHRVAETSDSTLPADHVHGDGSNELGQCRLYGLHVWRGSFDVMRRQYVLGRKRLHSGPIVRRGFLVGELRRGITGATLARSSNGNNKT